MNFKLLVFEDIIVTFATFAQATQEEFLISMFDVNKSTCIANIYTIGVSPNLVSRWREVYSFWGI